MGLIRYQMIQRHHQLNNNLKPSMKRLKKGRKSEKPLNNQSRFPLKRKLNSNSKGRQLRSLLMAKLNQKNTRLMRTQKVYSILRRM